jgi:hypothetical protein
MHTLPTIEYDLVVLRHDLINLRSQLSKRMQEIGWIESAYSCVKYSDPEVTNSVRARTQNLSSALCVLYFVVMVESYFPNVYTDSITKQRNLWEEINQYGWLSDLELERLRAYRHIRHTFAHDPYGKRAKQNSSSFTRVMESANPLPSISYTSDTVVVQMGASVRMVDEIDLIIQNVLSRMLSSPEYGAKPRL